MRLIQKEDFMCNCGCGIANPSDRLVRAYQNYQRILNAPIDILVDGACAKSGERRNSPHFVSPDKTHIGADSIVLGGKDLLQSYFGALRVLDFNTGGIEIRIYNKSQSLAGYLHLDIRPNLHRGGSIGG